MTEERFVELVLSFKELPCGICSEEFYDGEIESFREYVFYLLKVKLNDVHSKDL